MKILSLVLLLVIAYVLAAAFLYFQQRSFLYFPVPVVQHQFDEVSYELDGANIKVIRLNEENEAAILYFGGNAETVEYTAPMFDSAFANYTTYLVKYRGYGGSTGEATEQNNYTDALSIFDDLAKVHTQIIVVGRSLGSGVATYIAANREVKKLVLITPYDSMEALAKKSYPVFPVSLLLKDKYDSAGRAGGISASTLLMIAENDNVIGRSHSETLLRAFKPEAARMVVIANTGHNTISDSQEYVENLCQFIKSDGT